jgi:hypothetical protein
MIAMTIFTIFFGSSIFLPIIYFQFLSFRYLCSPLTKEAFREMDGLIEKRIIAHPSLPPWAKKGYTTFKVSTIIINFRLSS